MIDPGVWLPTLLGVCFLVAGITTYRREVRGTTPWYAFGLALAPVFVASALAAFAGEHFTAARSLAELVPRWLPARLFIAYFVGVAHLAAALSLVARRYVRWSALGLVVMFGLFVLLMDFPGAVRHPTARLSWILTARETTFAMGGLALLATETRRRRPAGSRMLITIARVWTAAVLVFYGIEHFLHPELSPGVPDTRLTASWVPLPLEVAVATGILLVASGAAMLIGRYARAGAALGGFLMLLLTLALYVPEFVRAANVADHVNALNFIFDTLLFAGMVLMVGRAIVSTGSRPESPTGV